MAASWPGVNIAVVPVLVVQNEYDPNSWLNGGLEVFFVNGLEYSCGPKLDMNSGILVGQRGWKTARVLLYLFLPYSI